MAGVHELYTLDALANAPRWIEARSKARGILALLDIASERPVMDWVTYVPGGPETD